ncbi:hypothetical protein V6N13_142789 [Hibiscus sabdariffa]
MQFILSKNFCSLPNLVFNVKLQQLSQSNSSLTAFTSTAPRPSPSVDDLLRPPRLPAVAHLIQPTAPRPSADANYFLG